MAIQYYDKALTEKIQDWINDPKIHVYRPEEVSWMLQQKSDENNDKPIALPFLALSRETEINIENPNKNPLSYDGLAIRLYDDKGKEVHLKSAFKLNAIPIRLSYQLDIYTKGLEEACEYVRELVFRLINNPKIQITIPYNGVNLQHKSSIQVYSQIEDNSDIPQRLYPGQFTRFTIKMTIDDAYLFSVVDRQNILIDKIRMEIMDKESKETEVEILTINS